MIGLTASILRSREQLSAALNELNPILPNPITARATIRRAHVIGKRLLLLAAVASVIAQNSDNSRKPAARTEANAPRFGKSYATLRPEQKRLVDDYIRIYNTTTGSRISAETTYDAARLSVRTTFDAVTHALLNARITDQTGKSQGRAIDLVDAVDEIMGEEADARGDRQFRLYVHLKPRAFDILSDSREFVRDRDNTTYHKGFPICFRLKNGPPSIQVSISRNRRMADIDVDYRSSAFPKALFNGHLTASNSDVRAGNNFDRHDSRWQGLNGWWREVFGFDLASGKGTLKAEARAEHEVPVNPITKADQGVDAAAHEFLKSWVVDNRPNNAIAYFSRVSYPCFEEIAKKHQEPIPQSLMRVRIRMAMENFQASTGSVVSVEDAFEAPQDWLPALKAGKNSYPREFRMVAIPPDIAQDVECVVPTSEEGAKKTKEKYFETAFRAKKGIERDQIMSLLWAREWRYWKIVAIRIEDSSNAGMPLGKRTSSAAEAAASAAVPKTFIGDSDAVRAITDFYDEWLAKRDAARAAGYASERSYACLGPISERKAPAGPQNRLHATLAMAIQREPNAPNLPDLMSSAEPVDDLMRPVGHRNSKAFAIMAVPDQMAESYLCGTHQVQWKKLDLGPSELRYGSFFLSASHLNLDGGESPPLLLLWTREDGHWKIIASEIELP